MIIFFFFYCWSILLKYCIFKCRILDCWYPHEVRFFTRSAAVQWTLAGLVEGPTAPLILIKNHYVVETQSHSNAEIQHQIHYFPSVFSRPKSLLSRGSTRLNQTGMKPRLRLLCQPKVMVEARLWSAPPTLMGRSKHTSASLSVGVHPTRWLLRSDCVPTKQNRRFGLVGRLRFQSGGVWQSERTWTGTFWWMRVRCN